MDKYLILEQLVKQIGVSKLVLIKYASDDCKSISPFIINMSAKFYGVFTDSLMKLSNNKDHLNTELQNLYSSDNMIIAKLLFLHIENSCIYKQ